MSNNLLNISMITEEALMVLVNELVFASFVNREYEDRFGIDGAKIGDTVNVRRPGRFIGTSGPALNVEDLNETSIPVMVGNLNNTNPNGDQFHVDVQFTTKDLRLALGPFSERIVKPAAAAIANRIDNIGLLMAKNATANIVGTPGVRPVSLLTYLNAAAFLDSEAFNRASRNIVIEQFTNAAIVDSLKSLFTPTDKIGEQYREGLMGRDSSGMNWYMSQNVANHTFGAWTTNAGVISIVGSNQGLASGWASTSTLTLTATQALSFNQGDIIQIANVFPVNPQSRQPYGSGITRTFNIQSAVTASANTNFVVTVAPALIFGGQFQNVNSSPLNGAAVTPLSLGTNGVGQLSPQNLLVHRNAFTLASVDLPLPEAGVVFAGRANDKENGMSVRIIKQYTINNDALPSRMDVLFGWAPLYQEGACRVAA